MESGQFRRIGRRGWHVRFAPIASEIRHSHKSSEGATRGIPLTTRSACPLYPRKSSGLPWSSDPGVGPPVDACVTATLTRLQQRSGESRMGNHARQRALDCPHQSTNDVGFRPFLTCSIAACDNDGGGAPEAVVIPPCNCSANRGVDGQNLSSVCLHRPSAVFYGPSGKHRHEPTIGG